MANVGTLDRGARFLAGIVLIALCFLPTSAPVFAGLGVWRWVLLAAGVAMLATATLRFCPAYTLLGVSTCTRK